MTISTPLDVALDGRDALIAIGMNGEPLPREHGFPARMVVPGLYGFVSACKWITRMTLTTYDASRPTGPSATGRSTPRSSSPAGSTPPSRCPTSDAGTVVIGGIAWAQHVGIEQGRGPRRRRGLAAGDARPAGDRRLLAPVVLRVGRQPGQHFIACRADQQGRRRPDRRPRAAVPRGLQRPPGDLGLRRLSPIATRSSSARCVAQDPMPPDLRHSRSRTPSPLISGSAPIHRRAVPNTSRQRASRPHPHLTNRKAVP